MFVDITIKENAFVLKVHKKTFENESLPLSAFQTESPLMQKYGYLGIFHIDGESLGFDGCFKKSISSEDYSIYTYTFPNKENVLEMRKMILSIYLLTYYTLEQMHYHKEFFDTNIWDKQSLSFVIFNGDSNLLNGYPIGGNVYPWFKKSLSSLSEDNLNDLNDYVKTELNRINNHFSGTDIYSLQINILHQSFFIQININGRWISWNSSRDSDKKEEFHSHNIDFRSDQELCFIGILLINTWLREYDEKVSL